jgi:hypothetical protein
MADETLLVLSGIGVPPYSARGLSETLTPIDASANLRRTVNGVLVDLSLAEMRKYHLSISCNDQQPPALDGVWPGTQITVNCVTELCYLSSGSPSRSVVGGSSRTESGFTFYRPALTMALISFQQTKDEYGAVTSWQLDLEEV